MTILPSKAGDCWWTAGRAKSVAVGLALSVSVSLVSCGAPMYGKKGVKPEYTFPVTSNETPYSGCLRALAKIPGNNVPAIAVGQVADRTGQINYQENGNVLTQGVSEMVMSALYKTRKTELIERYDLRIPLAELKMHEQKLTNIPVNTIKIRPSDFVILGALTELNYNIVSDGVGLWIQGVGAGVRTVVINIALDLRVVDSRTFAVRYVSSLQKQIYGFEVEANIFRFFGNQLVEFDAGRIANEPLQLGVRSVVEMATYQIMTDFLGLPKEQRCELVEPEFFKDPPASDGGSKSNP